MIYNFEKIIQDGYSFPVLFALFLNMDYWYVLESRLEYHEGNDSV